MTIKAILNTSIKTISNIVIAFLVASLVAFLFLFLVISILRLFIIIKISETGIDLSFVSIFLLHGYIFAILQSSKYQHKIGVKIIGIIISYIGLFYVFYIGIHNKNPIEKIESFRPIYNISLYILILGYYIGEKWGTYGFIKKSKL
jgi:hypothetical protein